MKSISLTLALLLVFSLLICGCSNKSEKPNANENVTETEKIENNKDVPLETLKKYLNCTEEDVIFETSDYNELCEECADIYHSHSNGCGVIELLNGEFDFFKSYSSLEADEYKDVLSNYNVQSIKVGDFRFIAYKGDYGAEKWGAYFNITESQCPIMPTGEYYYHVDPISWTRLDKFQPDEKYEEVVTIVNNMADFGAYEWDASKSTDSSDDFSFAVCRTISRYAYDNEIEDAMTDENIKKYAKSIFGIEDYIPTYVLTNGEELYKLDENGYWTETVHIGATSTHLSITDIRQIDTTHIEIDIQYYADAMKFLPSHKATVYITEQNDEIFEYCLTQAVITERSEFEPFRIGV